MLKKAGPQTVFLFHNSNKYSLSERSTRRISRFVRSQRCGESYGFVTAANSPEVVTMSATTILSTCA